jgi:DMSO reductase family type II enzyme heme b subunit
MKQTLTLVAAPTPMQPGGYVPVAYAGREQPFTPSATVEAERAGGGWNIRLSWSCPDPVHDIASDTDRFVDAAALSMPKTLDAPWITMGAPGKAVEGVLWRANETQLRRFQAEGLGSVQRSAAPPAWTVKAEWANGTWALQFDVPAGTLLDEHFLLAFAIWRGAANDRGGLKSVSPGWIELPR